MADSTVKVPWEQDGEEFDAEKAKSYLTSLLNDKQKLQDRNKELQSKSKSGSSEAEELRKENLKLQVQMQTGLNDNQIKRLVGDSLDELMADAEAFAEETGITLRSFFEDPEAGEGTPDEDQDGAQGESEPKHVSRNFRAPGQKQAIEEPVDYDKISANLDI